MARKRMLAPEIWHDKNCIKLTTPELMVWIGCISTADDEGIIEPEPESLYFEIARKDLSVSDISDAIDRITELGMIVRYDKYAFLPNWYRHQALSHPTETKLKRPPRAIVERYPDYVDGWEAAFSYWTKDQETKKRIKVEVKYPYRDVRVGDSGSLTEDSVSDHGVFSESSVSDHCALREHSLTAHSKENRSEEKGIEEKGREQNKNSKTAAKNGSRVDEPVDNSEQEPGPFDDLPDPEPEPDSEAEKPPSEYQQLVDAAMTLHQQATGSAYAFSGEDGKHLQQVRKKLGFDEAMTRLRRYYTGEYWFTADGQYSLRAFHRHVNELAANGARASPTPEDRETARNAYLAKMYPERYGQEVAT